MCRFPYVYSCLSLACRPYSALRYLSDQQANTFCNSKFRINQRMKKIVLYLKSKYPWSKKAKVVVSGMCKILKGIGIRSSGVNFFFLNHSSAKLDKREFCDNRNQKLQFLFDRLQRTLLEFCSEIRRI